MNLYYHLFTCAAEICLENFFSMVFESRRYIDVDLLKSSQDSLDRETIDGWDVLIVLLEDDVFMEEFHEEFIEETRIKCVF